MLFFRILFFLIKKKKRKKLHTFPIKLPAQLFSTLILKINVS